MNKRDLIIASAIELFVKQGFHSTSTTSITKHAGVGTGTLFSYFDNKDELINSIYRELKAEFLAYLLENIEVAGTPYKRFKSLWRCAIVWACEHYKKFQFLHQFSHTPIINDPTKEEGVLGFSFVFELLEQAIIDEYIKPIPVDLFYSMVFGNIHAVVEYIKSKDLSAEFTAEDSFMYLWEGIRK